MFFPTFLESENVSQELLLRLHKASLHLGCHMITTPANLSNSKTDDQAKQDFPNNRKAERKIPLAELPLI